MPRPVFVFLVLACSVAAAEPEQREIPLPSIPTTFPVLPGPDSLPIHQELPSVLTRDDGTQPTATCAAFPWNGHSTGFPPGKST